MGTPETLHLRAFFFSDKGEFWGVNGYEGTPQPVMDGEFVDSCSSVLVPQLEQL